MITLQLNQHLINQAIAEQYDDTELLYSVPTDTGASLVPMNSERSKLTEVTFNLQPGKLYRADVFSMAPIVSQAFWTTAHSAELIAKSLPGIPRTSKNGIVVIWSGRSSSYSQSIETHMCELTNGVLGEVTRILGAFDYPMGTMLTEVKLKLPRLIEFVPVEIPRSLADAELEYRACKDDLGILSALVSEVKGYALAGDDQALKLWSNIKLRVDLLGGVS